MLHCNIKGVTYGFRLHLEVVKFVEKVVEFNFEFLRNVFPKIEWRALVGSARSLGYADLPVEVADMMVVSEEFLRRFHHALLVLWRHWASAEASSRKP